MGQRDDHISLSLTYEQLKKLEGILSATEDCGPTGEGWCSDELIGLQDIVSEAMEGVP